MLYLVSVGFKVFIKNWNRGYWSNNIVIKIYFIYVVMGVIVKGIVGNGGCF